MWWIVALVAVAIVLMFMWYVKQNENYLPCTDCAVVAPYQLEVLNPFIYPYSGSDDLHFLVAEKGLDAPYFPPAYPTPKPEIPMTHAAAPDHVLHVGYGESY